MFKSLRTAIVAVASFCVLVGGSLAVPSFAEELALPSLANGETLDAQYAALAEPKPIAETLALLVEDQRDANIRDEDERCLATAVYFEAKSESPEGQLAVAQVILNRARSGRFPESICSIVTQPSQFSFVRGGRLPAIPQASAAWARAVAVARIAQNELWSAVAPQALFFHAMHVSPRWGNVTRVTRIGNHIFYR